VKGAERFGQERDRGARQRESAQKIITQSSLYFA
jgi:hypothetical protein